MCDYSLEAYRSRPARVGEQYVTHRFPSHGVGFIAAGDTDTAVCMACDMKLHLEDIPHDVRARWGVSADETVTFVRLDEGQFHDGVRFANGAEIALHRLGAGVKGSLIEERLSPSAERELERVSL
jgi:hypothetical protein